MFYGEYQHNLDIKGRLILPSKFREACQDHHVEKFFITRGLDKCLFMFAEEEWRLQEKKFKNISFTKKESRSFNRMFFSGAIDAVPDKQGRFILPKYLKDYATIDKETVMIGVSNRIEIWNKQSWQSFYENSNESFEQIAENMLDL